MLEVTTSLFSSHTLNIFFKTILSKSTKKNSGKRHANSSLSEKSSRHSSTPNSTKIKNYSTNPKAGVASSTDPGVST